MMNTVNETVTIAPCKSTTDPAVQKIEGEDIYMKKLVTNTESMILCHVMNLLDFSSNVATCKSESASFRSLDDRAGDARSEKSISSR